MRTEQTMTCLDFSNAAPMAQHKRFSHFFNISDVVHREPSRQVDAVVIFPCLDPSQGMSLPDLSMTQSFPRCFHSDKKRPQPKRITLGVEETACSRSFLLLPPSLSSMATSTLICRYPNHSYIAPPGGILTFRRARELVR